MTRDDRVLGVTRALAALVVLVLGIVLILVSTARAWGDFDATSPARW